MKKTEAMISVEPTKAILGFAFPLILGNVFQQLYTFIDTLRPIKELTRIFTSPVR